ncbi:MAG: DUF5916 domain-containing protein, partial [Bacteroidota bacterium]
DKISGQWNYGVGHNVESEHFDPNDFGFLFAANSINYFAYGNYNIFEPFWKLNRMRAGASIWYDRLFAPNTFTSYGIDVFANATTRGFHTFGVGASWKPDNTFDYFEPRKTGSYFIFPQENSFNAFISSDYRRRLAIDGNFWMYNTPIEGWKGRNYRLAPRFRVNDQLFLVYVYSWQNSHNERGFSDFDADNNTIIGTRDVISHTNVLTLSYIFTNRMGLTFRARHYWSTANYKQFYQLYDFENTDDASLHGSLSNSFTQYVDEYDDEGNPVYGGINDDGTSANNRSFTAFNIDLVYTWVFSPGSELRIVWKNAILDQEEVIPDDLLDNVNRTFTLPQNNSFSVRLLYFIDYLSLKRKGSSIKN